MFVFLPYFAFIVDQYGNYVYVALDVLVHIVLKVHFKTFYLFNVSLIFNLVESSNTTGANDYPVHIINNEGLPDYETIVKDTTVKDLTPPPYNFVTSHPNDFGIEQAAPNAPPQYTSRPNSAAVNVPNILPVS